ncbi:MAG TPA: glutathione S-transferase family protein [Kofleriaceae bacterium]|jgi:glutathione S-transferase|nr:glutathione S-transferase family protein [Kofleriaceae bacterium]
MLEYVDLAAAKEATGTRIVVAGAVPSPWSQATKGMFRIAKLPAVVVRKMPGDREPAAWTGVDNVPVVLHGKEPARTSAVAIVALVARLAPDAGLVPHDPGERADVMGLVELFAGEDGLGWNGRLAMIHAGIVSDGARGFGQPVAGYLAKRYGYDPAERSDVAARNHVRARVAAQLAHLEARLAGRDYFGGERPNAVDIYAATFLTPLFALGEADCPRILPMVRQGFAAAAEEFGALVPAALAALRARMFERHLAWPIEL